MSIAHAETQTLPPVTDTQDAIQGALLDRAREESLVQEVLDRVQTRIAPVWPLKDYVASNPYAGISEQKFLAARQSLRAVSDLETLMPLDYYREQYVAGSFHKADVDLAIDELVADGVTGAERLEVNGVVALLRGISDQQATVEADCPISGNPSRTIRTLAEMLDQQTGSHWCRVICEEISKHCSAHYDEGQAAWQSHERDLPLYEAWQSAARHDRSFEMLGVSNFRKTVAHLPSRPSAALVELLSRLQVPQELWEKVLLCAALSMPGWSAWTKYQQRQAAQRDEDDTDFIGLLAMRLAYEAALAEHVDFHVNWISVAEQQATPGETTSESDDVLLRYTLLKASEIALRKRLLGGLASSNRSPSSKTPGSDRTLAQMVFCIDVRSERIRRHLEAASGEIETFGFAGFFGLPIEFVPLGERTGNAQVPVLISPQFKVGEQIDAADGTNTESAIENRSVFRFLRKSWKDFQASAVSCFAFVETTGLFYGFKLLARSIGYGQTWASRFDGVSAHDRQRLSPTLQGLAEQGVTTSKQADLAESILRGIGIVEDFARLVVFCGHASQTENNPLQAGLDCGACGGHSGEANARLAAKLLNQASVRQALAERGIVIPEETRFVAAPHNTTTDALEFFDTLGISASHEGDLHELRRCTDLASRQTRIERLAVLPGTSDQDLVRRSRDWSEIRPEWGLAGNAAFIAAPRELTESVSLDGRSFLHSYDHRNDPQFAILEQIMTAPLVVAHLINMQYYASTVDPLHFGSGNKAVHNVVGRFGILSGNGGDLMTGLPWQSVHDGKQYQHHPLRLLAILAAPRAAIEAIIAKHEVVENLLKNGWLQLIAVEDDTCYRYTEQQQWDELQVGPPV